MTQKKGYVTAEFGVSGMECTSCERIIARTANKIKGVKDVSVSYEKGSAEISYDPAQTSSAEIASRIYEKGYQLTPKAEKDNEKFRISIQGIKNTAVIVGLIVIALGVYSMLSNTLDSAMPVIGQDTSIAIIFVIGLFTGLHCIAMCGGFVVSYTTQSNGSLKSHIYYGAAKTLSYALLGAVFGYLGSYITFTPALRGAAAAVAGTFLVLFGLNMLDMVKWFRRLRLKTPAFANNLIGKHAGSSNPAVIGFLNGFMIACGPLQAMYLLAASSGSPETGALYMMSFGLGTLPALLGFGVFASVLSLRFTKKIIRYSGVLVITLGLIMVNRGLALSGSGYDINTVSQQIAPPVDTQADVGYSATIDGEFQVIHMNVTRYGWQPDRFILKKGMPVKWVIDGQEITSCNNAIQVPKYNLKFGVKRGLQTIEFTPTESGTIPWSCWMGMIPGTFEVVDYVPAQNMPTSTSPNKSAKTTTTTILYGESSTATSPTAVEAVPPQSKGDYQEIRMNVTYAGWQPNTFVLKTGVPVKWIINGQQLSGCNNAIKVPSLGLSFDINQGEQTIEFTPTKAGTIPWSCWMGMIRGTFIVKDSIDTGNQEQVQKVLDESPPTPSGGSCSMGGGGCGCGMMRY